MKLSLLVIVFFSFFTANSFVFNNVDTALYTTFYKKAEEAKLKKEFEKAIVLYKKALANSDVLLKELIVNQKIAGMFFVLGKVDSAEFWVAKNLSVDKKRITTNELKAEVARSYNIIRAAGIRSGDYKRVEKALGKGIEILEGIKGYNFLLRTYYIDLAINHWRMGNYDDAIIWCKKGMQTAPKLNSTESKMIQIRACITLGLTYCNKRDLRKAIEYYKQVFRFIGDDKKTYIRDFTITCNNLAIVYTERESYDSANLYYRYALMNLDLIGVEFTDQMLAYKSEFLNNMGINYSGLGKYKEAEAHHQKALECRIITSGKLHPEVARILIDIANVCVKQKKFYEARDHLLIALHIRKNSSAISRSELSKVYNIFGDLYYGQGDNKKSKIYFDSALLVNPRIALTKETIYADVRESWHSFSGKMKNLIAEKNFSNEPDELDLLYENIKTQMNYAFTRTSDSILKQDVQLLFNDLFEIYYQLFQRANDQKYLSRMWEISEFKKGFRLNTQLNNQIAMSTLLPKELVQKEKTVKDSLILLTTKKFEGSNIDSVLFIYKKKYDDLMEQFEKDYTDYYTLKYSIIQTPLEQALTSAKGEKVCANFFETRKNLYTMCLSENGVLVSKCESSKLDSLTKQMNLAISQNDTLKIRLYSKVQKEELFPADLDFKKIKTLEVLPDGRAWKIHFSLLSDRIFPRNKIDFIGKKINIVYQYSFDHLRLTEKSRKQNNSKILAFSSSDQPMSTQDLSYVKFRNLESDLPGASIEIKEISKDWDGDYYFASLANEATFKEKCKDYQIIHLALHGFLDDQYPAYSRLKFSNGDNSSDGLLYPYEIYGLNVGAELVVLSACNSGTGKIENGEGIESLGRAFAFAGANSLLLSKWEVSDATTPLIMKYFYEGLKEGLTKSEALRLAKVKFLEHDADNITSSPYYWDSFYVLGDDKPIEKGFPAKKILWVSGVMLFIFLLVWSIRKTKHK